MGSRSPLAGKKTTVVSCCHENVDWGIAVKTRRNGRRMKKRRRTKLEGEERGGGKEAKKTQEKERRQRRAGDRGCTSLLSCPAPLRGLTLLCVFRDASERSCDWSTLHWVALAWVTAVLGITPKEEGEAHVEKGRWGSGERGKVYASVLPKNVPRYLFQ